MPTNVRSHRVWLAALAYFSRLQAAGRVASHGAADPRGQRLAVILTALDGSLNELSQREIASMMIGARSDADWRHPGQHLRDRVRRAVKRGRALMNGGYLALLR